MKKIIFWSLFTTACFLMALASFGAASSLDGEVFQSAGTTGTNALPGSRSTNTITLIKSSAAATDPALRVNTTRTHTGGNLIEIQNNGTNRLYYQADIDYLTVIGGSTSAGLYLESPEVSYIDIFASGDDAKVSGTSNGGNTFELYADASDMWLALSSRTFIWPTAPDASTAYKFDTTVSHTSGNLVEVKNNGTNVAVVSPWGTALIPRRVQIGPNYSSYAGIVVPSTNNTTLYGYYAASGFSEDGQGKVSLDLEAVDSTSASGLAYLTVVNTANGSTTNSSFKLTAARNSGSDGAQWEFAANPHSTNTGTYFAFNKSVGGVTKQPVKLIPWAPSGTTPARLGSGVSFTSGNLFSVVNNTDTNVFSVRYDGAILPGATSAIWTSGTGTPEGNVTAGIGSLYTRTDGGAGTTLYVKESGAGNTGWAAK